jgi:hypothetical protein
VGRQALEGVLANAFNLIDYEWIGLTT